MKMKKLYLLLGKLQQQQTPHKNIISQVLKTFRVTAILSHFILFKSLLQRNSVYLVTVF